jgi:glycosyltransferase involved in cell wall biosynthesis
MLVSCICITQPGRENFVEQAVQCFDDQDFDPKDRELVIVNDRKDGMTLGGLRNAAVRVAGGRYFMTWDDDDIYDPRRISAQFTAMQERGAEISQLLSITMRCKCGAEFPSHQRKGGWECTMMVLKSRAAKYPLINVCEDRDMIQATLNNGARSIVLRDGPEYIKRYHGENTIDRDGHRIIFRRAGHECAEVARVATA